MISKATHVEIPDLSVLSLSATKSVVGATKESRCQVVDFAQVATRAAAMALNDGNVGGGAKSSVTQPLASSAARWCQIRPRCRMLTLTGKQRDVK